MQQAVDYMKQALALARRGQFSTRPNPAVGCVIVKDGKTVGTGWHQQAGAPHAEIIALQAAGAAAQGASCYVTLEPCNHQGRTGPCCEALIAAGIREVVIAMPDPNPKVNGAGIARLQAAGISVSAGILAEEAESLNQGFCYSMRQQKPFVRLKLAASLDGRTAMANGESQWISCAEARLDVQQLRARSGALISGIGTVLSDNPRLDVRAEGWHADAVIPQPIRVILDSRMQIPLDAKLFSVSGEIWIVCAKSDPLKQRFLEQQGVTVLQFPGVDDKVDLSRVLQALHTAGVHEVIVEAGSTLNGAFLQQDLINEIWLYMAPVLMGDQARGLFHLPIAHMRDKIELTLKDLRSVGSNWRWIFSLKNG